jgi:hypothetical protein
MRPYRCPLRRQSRGWSLAAYCRPGNPCCQQYGIASPKRLTENELSDFRRLWHDGCGETIIEAQDVDRNHLPEV